MLAAALVAGGAASADDASTRAEFVQQLAAAELPPGMAVAEDSAALRAYALYPYLQAQRLRQPLRYAQPADDAAIAAFLARDDDAPWTRELRRDWLLDLARRQQWELFLQHDLEARADARLRCHRLSALLATTPAEPAAQAQLESTLIGQWMTGTRLPEACVAPFEAARARGWLTPERLQQRAQLALEAGNIELAEFLLRGLPPEAAPQLRAWSRLLAAPERELDALAAGGSAALQAQLPQAVAAAFTKLARRDPAAAAPRLAALERACGQPCALRPPATLAELRRELALGYAWSRMPEAVATFAAVDAAVLDERAHEWRVRAALWARDWARAADWLAQLPPALAQQARWRYWQARALGALGQQTQARERYEALLRENNWYALLAAARLGRPFAPTPLPAPPPEPAALQQLAALPGVQRTRELWLAQRPAWSAAEWAEVLATLDTPQLLQAARLPQTWGAPLQTVIAASRAQLFDDFDLLYPRPFEPQVRRASAASGVPAEWIYAVMRQESLYDPRARSAANAYGLLQLLHGTARDVARRNGLPSPSLEALFEPATNLQLGAVHLRELLGRYGQELALVLGAYNAGPRPVERWRPREPLDLDIWVENVPYNETRAYIQRVFWHAAVFEWRASGRAQRYDDLLRSIGPRPGAR